jgi:RNA polymerase-binding transcription factor DksA
MSKCILISGECAFKSKTGNCLNPQVSLENDCLGNTITINDKKETIKIIKRHLKGIEKAIDKLEEQEFCGVCGRELSKRETHTQAIKDTPDNACNQCRKER